MSVLPRHPGVCVAFGDTNARVSDIVNGQPERFHQANTPENPDEFFGWVASTLVDAERRGADWAVLGFPGPVSEDGRHVGSFANIHGLNHEGAIDLLDNISRTNNEAGRIIDQGFKIIPVNDAELAAQAVATTQQDTSGKNKIGALMIGKRVGLGVVVPQQFESQTVYVSDVANPYEFGHTIININPNPAPNVISASGDILQTYETTYSGPALARAFGARDFGQMLDKFRANGGYADQHPAVKKLARGIVMMTNNLGPLYGVDFVAPTGAIGIKAIPDYKNAYLEALELWRQGAQVKPVQAKFKPEVALLEGFDADSFELHGALAVVHSRLAVAAQAVPIRLNTVNPAASA